ncbi:hypothetical protein J4050_14820 [Winogradskyella sp. DF17]|uniref:Uncharacterized protein n=1 Tax=Winogradskyella pelagia TaxID=2819984 RepID=A0ABS3T5L4_9FLAO|nr:hypothetical protein [Winogradskyella sp. DF17]
MYDLLGRAVIREILETSLNRSALNAGELGCGIYIGELQKDNQKVSQKSDSKIIFVR